MIVTLHSHVIDAFRCLSRAIASPVDAFRRRPVTPERDGIVDVDRRMGRRARALALAALACALAGARATEIECAAARRTCERTVERAIGDDGALMRFVDDARTRARTATRGAAVAHALTLDAARARGGAAEMFALGCCAMDGGCVEDVGTEAEKAAVRAVGADALFAAQAIEDAVKFPWAGTLGADARACARGRGCDAESAAAYEKSGNAGDELGKLRAGDAALRRYAAGLASRIGGEGVVEVCDASLGGDAGDAARARTLYKELLTSNAFDKVASERLREVTRLEELWIDPSKGGKPDMAYAMADALVKLTVRVSVALAVLAVSYVYRDSRWMGGLWRLVRTVLLFGIVIDTIARVRAFIKWLRWKPPVANTRAARREEKRRERRKSGHHA